MSIISVYCKLKGKEVSVKMNSINSLGNSEPQEEFMESCLDNDESICRELKCKPFTTLSGKHPF